MNVLTATPSTVTAKPAKQFLNYIHYFRGVAIIFVIAGHLLLQWPAGSKTHLFLQVFWENGTVLFIFIAGYLFQHLSKKFEYKSYLIKKLQNVIIPYLIISIPIIIYRVVKNDIPGYTLQLHADFYSWSALQKIIYFLLHGAHLQQLWFVPMIALFYVSAPLLIYIDRHPKLYYSLFVFVFISFMVEREPLSDILKMFVHFFSVYVFGMFMSHYKNRYLEFAKKNWLLITFLTIGCFVLNLIFFTYNDPLNYIHKMLFCCFFIYWLWKLDAYIPRQLAYLADISFGIFFIHYYFILVYRGLYQKIAVHPLEGSILNWLIVFAFTLGCSVAVLKLVKKLFPKNSRYIVGC